MRSITPLKNRNVGYYQIAGVTIEVGFDLAMTGSTFHPKFRAFEVDGPGEDTIKVRHRFHLPDANPADFGDEVYRRAPLAIYKRGGSWVYSVISKDPGDKRIRSLALFSHDHSRGEMYHDETVKEVYRRGNLPSLTLFSTDQILLARVLADRKGCYVHSSGVILDGKGFLFVGHSDAGKSTMARMLKGRAEILCDDRVIVREWPDGMRIHGTWSHGIVPDVSPNCAPLKAILLLEQSRENCLVPVNDQKTIARKMLACLVKPLVTVDWWDKMLPLIGRMASEVPCFFLKFDKSGRAVDLLEEL